MKIRFIILIINLLWVSINASGQILLTESDIINLESDSVVMKVGDFRGKLNWQYSENGNVWNDIINAESDVLVLPTFGSFGYYRLKVIDGTCAPIYSEVALIKYEVPAVVTHLVTSVSKDSARFNGEVTNDGGTEVSLRGFYWSKTNVDPDSSDNIELSGIGKGIFFLSVNGLVANSTYYVRSFASNSEGTSLGNVVSFTTSTEMATLVTNTVTNIASTSAKFNGEVTGDGGTPETIRGFYWSKTNASPDSNNSIEFSGSGKGIYNSLVNGLEAGTTYYVRGFASNNAGTSLGNVVSFTTLTELATVVTNEITNITTSSATFNGEVTGDGGEAITMRGFYWSNTSTNPDSNDSIEIAGIGKGKFNSSVINLEANTTYYVRSFASNSQGTSLGDVKFFKTLSSNLPAIPQWK